MRDIQTMFVAQRHEDRPHHRYSTFGLMAGGGANIKNRREFLANLKARGGSSV